MTAKHEVISDLCKESPHGQLDITESDSELLQAENISMSTKRSGKKEKPEARKEEKSQKRRVKQGKATCTSKQICDENKREEPNQDHRWSIAVVIHLQVQKVKQEKKPV